MLPQEVSSLFLMVFKYRLNDYRLNPRKDAMERKWGSWTARPIPETLFIIYCMFKKDVFHFKTWLWVHYYVVILIQSSLDICRGLVLGSLWIPKAMEAQVSYVKWCSTVGCIRGVSQITVESMDVEPEAGQLYVSSIMIVCSL